MTNQANKVSRKFKRQQETALQIFNKLWNEFIEFDLGNSITEKGYVKYKADIQAKLRALHNSWKFYANNRNANPKSMGFKVMAFHEKADAYLAEKEKQVWISYTREQAFKLYGFKTHIEDFEEMYKLDLLPLAAIKSLILKTNPMLTINLSYHKLIGKYNKEVKFPESFEELTRKQFLSFVELAGQGYTDYELKIQFLRKNFFKLPITRIHALKKLSEKAKTKAFNQAYYNGWLDNSSSIHKLIKLLTFLSGTPEYLNNPAPKYRLLRGPSDRLKNISIWEFALAEKAMIDFAHEKDDKHLDVLAGILMRRISPAKWFKSLFTHVSDVRVDFNDELIAKYASIGSKMPQHYKFAMLSFFRSVRESFTEIFPNVYGSVEKKKTKSKEGNWGDVILDFSGEIPGKEEEVAAVNLYTFLYRIDKLIEKQRNAKN